MALNRDADAQGAAERSTAPQPARGSGDGAAAAHTPPTGADSGPVKRGRDGRRMNPRSLQNLQPGAGAWRPGQPSPNVKHGLRSRRPGAVLLGEAAGEIVDALAATVPLRGPDGDVDPRFVVAVEAAALQLIIVRRVLAYLTSHDFEDSRGRLRPEVEGLERATERLRKHLDGLGATPTSYARLGFDVARTVDLATAMSEPDPARRAALMAEAGVPIDVDGEEAEDER